MYKCILATLCVLMACAIVLADTVVLKDGTSIEGTVIKFGSQYRIKTADGQTKVVPDAQVKEVVKSGAKPPGGAPAGGTPTAPPKTNTPPTETAKPATGGAAFSATKAKADRVESPIIAVSIWEKFIESNPKSADLDAAKAELARWQKLQKDEAEKINGKWIGGDELDKLKDKSDKLVEQGYKDIVGNQTVQGLAKLEEALKIYPYSFRAHFELGYYYLSKGYIGSNGQGNLAYMDKAIKSLEAASKIMPESAATWSNLAIGYNFRKKYAESVMVAYKAAKIEDSKEIIQNLVNSIAQAPPGMQQNNAKLKPILEDAIILARKHGIDTKGGSWPYVRPHPPGEGPEPGQGAAGDEEGRPGPAWSGSGFFVTADGYIITNHHVATGDPKAAIKKNITFRVRLDDGTEKNAELIAIYDQADIAIMKIKPDAPVPVLKLAQDNPNQAAKSLVLGYPATGERKHTLQSSEGSVKSLHPGGDYEVWFDLNTTHGNSGGPIVDRACRVIGILTAGWQEYNMTIVGGVGPMQIKAFLDSLAEKAPPVQYAPASGGDFDGEKLTAEAKKCTVLIIAIRGAPSDSSTATESGAAETSGKDAKPGTGAGKKGAGAGVGVAG
jgi:S1-C subfamily serine protease